MTNFDKQRDEMQLSWEKTKKEMEKQQEMFLESWKKTREEMERQFSEMMEEYKKTYGTITFDYKFPGLDSCTKECIMQQLIMQRNYYAMIDKELRERYRSIQGKKDYTCELRELVSAIKTIDKLYYQVNDMIKELQSTDKFQRRLKTKKNNK